MDLFIIKNNATFKFDEETNIQSYDFRPAVTINHLIGDNLTIEYQTIENKYKYACHRRFTDEGIYANGTTGGGFVYEAFLRRL